MKKNLPIKRESRDLTEQNRDLTRMRPERHVRRYKSGKAALINPEIKHERRTIQIPHNRSAPITTFNPMEKPQIHFRPKNCDTPDCGHPDWNTPPTYTTEAIQMPINIITDKRPVFDKDQIKAARLEQAHHHPKEFKKYATDIEALQYLLQLDFGKEFKEWTPIIEHLTEKIRDNKTTRLTEQEQARLLDLKEQIRTKTWDILKKECAERGTPC